MDVSHVSVKNVLTRTGGYLATVTSHSLQPYRGCSFGRALCGVGCYVRHNGHITRGREWGGFLEVRDNAAESYLAHVDREAKWARRNGGEFSIFCSSSTDPFVQQESRLGVTRRLLAAMISAPPDLLILQTHSDRVTSAIEQLQKLRAAGCRVRVHVSIESDRDTLPGLPPPACSVERRLAACRELRSAGLFTVVTVAPLLPIRSPEEFFARVAEAADAVVLDHFIGGDGSRGGTRTLRTPLPAAMEAVDPRSIELSYRDEMSDVARKHLPGRVDVGVDGFAGRLWRDR